MPFIAIWNHKLIDIKEIYRRGIPKTGPFTCLCGKNLILRQQRTAKQSPEGLPKKYTEHFYHPNSIKGPHKSCCYANTKKNPQSEWHQQLSECNKYDSREYLTINPKTSRKHFVDVYDISTNRGLEFQHSPISSESIQSREETTKLDWIFDVTSQYIAIWEELIMCEIPTKNWEQAVTACKNKVFLHTGKKEWILLEDRRSFHIEIENKKRNVWIGKIQTFEDVIRQTCLKNTLLPKGKQFLTSSQEIERVGILYGRCNDSMALLDPLIREFVFGIEFEKTLTYAIKCVAGGGKTTTLLKLAKENPDEKILYLSFNRSLVQEIERQPIPNLYSYTLDGFIRQCFISKTHFNFNIKIQHLRPSTFTDLYPWFRTKPFTMKQKIINKYNEFCRNTSFLNMIDFMKSKYPGSSYIHLSKMWQDTCDNKLITFNGLRKLALVQHWFKDYVDKRYDMIFVDEAQDFEPIMLEMILKDISNPKVFVGDPHQAIYEWRGAINSFDYLPSDTFHIEFYNSWRLGNPACTFIQNKFPDCWIVPGKNNSTYIHEDISPPITMKYDYLFRSWRHLLKTAAKTPHIWINNYETKIKDIKKLHSKLKRYPMSKEEKLSFQDDLPKFLITLDFNALNNLISNIEKNLVTEKESMCRMFTIHAYKGLENDNIRVFNDIGKDEINLYYVALTRSKCHTYLI